MNRQPKKAAGTIRPMTPYGPRGLWKAVAITATDPTEFAKEYEMTLNTLVADGWTVTGMITRGEAIVVTAQRPNVPPEIMEVIQHERNTPKGMTPFVPRTDSIQDIIYTYKDNDGVKTIQCSSLAEATSYLQEHVIANGEILPLSIVVMDVTSYEPSDLPLLLEMED